MTHKNVESNFAAIHLSSGFRLPSLKSAWDPFYPIQTLVMSDKFEESDWLFRANWKLENTDR